MFIKDLIKLPLFEGEDTGTGNLPPEETIEEEDKEEEEEKPDDGEEELEEEIVEEEDKEEEEKEEKEEKVKDETTEEQKKDSVIKQALAKHPKIFKEFPELRSAYFENKQFKEVFTSVDEAKEAVENSNVLAEVSADLRAGKSDKVINYLKGDPKVLTHFARNLIKELPKEVFSDALAPSVIGMLKEIKESALLHKNGNLDNAVGWISKYLFNNMELPTIKADEPEPEKKDNPLLTQIANDFRTDVTEDVITELNSVVDSSLASLKNAKPAVKKTLTNEIKDGLEAEFKKDPAHNKLMNKLWEDAKKNNYSRQSKASIKSAYLAAVKKRLPEVRLAVLKANKYVVKPGSKKTTDGEEKTPKFTKNSSTSSSMSSLDTKVAEMKKQGKTEREVMDAILGSK